MAMCFVVNFSQGQAKLAPSTIEHLQHYSWPGNVRELRNAMERAVLLSRSELIMPDHLPARLRSAEIPSSAVSGLAVSSSEQPIDDSKLEEIERQAVLIALEKHAFNRTETAKALGISRRALLYKLQHLRESGYKVDPAP